MKVAHPKGLYLLFSVEMWERFSFYGMKALLMLYMTKYFLFSDEKAGHTFGWYTGLVYLTPLLGGYIADRYIGARKSILIGGILMALGHFAMAFPGLSFFYLALGLLILGNGFFKPNISTIVGQLYEKDDPRRDGGFTIFYMGINLGAFFAPLVCGTLGEKYSWHLGFGVAGVGMVLGLTLYMIFQNKYLGDLGKKAVVSKNINNEKIENKPLTKVEKQRIAVIFVLSGFGVFFWSAFEQAGSSLTLFAERSINRVIPILNWEMPASYFQSINPLLIFILAPIFSKMWTKLAEKGKDPSVPIKFAIALQLLALGFLMMIPASYLFLSYGPVSLLWLVGVYFLHTIGELCLSPVGLSMVSRLAPAKFASLLMGTWFLSSFVAELTGGIFAGNYSKMSPVTFFMIPTLTAGIAGFVLFAISRPLKKWMNEDIDNSESIKN